MFENSFFISYPELFLYKYVSRETLKRSKDKHIHFNSVLSRILLYPKLNSSLRDSDNNF